jgi:catecholate siderophore receptor
MTPTCPGKPSLAAIIALCLAVPPVMAQDSAKAAEETLPEVKVVGQSEEGYAAVRTTTATKTDTPLRDVPQSITVVTREQIRDQGMQHLGDVVRYVPGAGMAQGEGNRETPVLRGNSSTADLFVNGMRDDVQYFRDLYNVERVEVLKGPNAMIFGRGGVGGVVNRVTRVADWNTVREISLQGGSYENRRITADFGQGFGKAFAGRLTGMYEKTQSYRDGFELERYGVNPTLAMRAGQDTVITVGYENFYDQRIADRGIPSFQGKPFATDESTFFGDPDQSPTGTEINAFDALVDHQFAEGLNLRNRTRYAMYDKYYQNVFAGGPVNDSQQVPITAYRQFTPRDNLFNQTDLIYAFATGPVKHTLLTGVELGLQESDAVRETGFFADGPDEGTDPDATLLVPAANPTTNAPVTFSPIASDGNNEGTTTVVAVYLQDQVEISRHFQVVAGLRYDHFQVDFTDRRPSTAAENRELETTDGLISPRVGLIYKPIEPASIYAAYSLTYLPRAGEQLTSITPSNKSLDPERFENYEVGAKWDLSPGLALTLALYQLDRKNVAITNPDPNAPPGTLILVDGQRTRGVELGVAGHITRAWSIAGGYAYQNGKLEATSGSTAQAGARLGQLPRNTIGLWNRYDFTPMWGAGLGVINRSDMFTTTSNTVRLDGYTRLDGAVFFKLNEHFRGQVNVENLLDEDYFLDAHNDNNITPGAPLNFLVSVTGNF